MNKRTRALAITPETKRKVYERDGGACILCGKPGEPNAHYIARSHGGLGIEQNIVTLCETCHTLYDQSADRRHIAKEIELYLRSKYEDFDYIQLVYRKEDF